MRNGLRKNSVFIFAFTMMLALLCGQVLQAAELKLSRYFTDNMVIQRGKPVIVRGFAEQGAEVTVAFAGQQKKATADKSGEWAVTLDPIQANSKPQELKVLGSKGGKPISIANIVVGDVFLMARQTSIDISLGRDKQGRAEADKVKKNPLFRSVSIQTMPAAEPQNDLVEGSTSGWSEISRDSALKMTASAYYFGRDLVAEADVPVGIVDLNLGYAFPVSWLSREALEETEKFYGRTDVPGRLSYYDKLLEAESTGVPLPKHKTVESNVVQKALFPAGGYNAVLHPLRGLALKAAMVQLGNDYPYMIYAGLENDGTQLDRDELNRTYVETYDIRKVGFRMEPVTTPRIPREWRNVFGDQDLPLGLILPPGSDLNTLGEHHREMREMQRLIAEDDQPSGVILPGSGNIPYSAQPEDDVLLGERCASWVKGAVYDKPDVAPTGPLFDRVEPEFNEATIYFKPGTAKGLTASGDALDYFEASGVDGEYSSVEASIDGETIQIKSKTVPRIVYVRYNWNQRPNQELVNATGLPAIPFRSQKADYHWFVTNSDDDLPIEYHTPANEWKKSDVTLINGQLKTHGYGNFTGWIGPAGFRTGPFGPNMGVREVKSGSPADGKVFEGDVIYSVNGNMLGDKAWVVMGAAVTESETRAAGGKMVLGLRRDGKNIDVEITLEVMGEYSPTAPFDCPKTEKIITDLENWVVDHGAGAGYLNTDALFMLATGNPDMQGYVRRIVYNIIANRDPSASIDPTKAGKSWHNSAEAILLGEYYLATGDRNVLPYLKHACDRLAATQNKQEGGWRHNFPGGAHYGLIPNAGLPGVMGMHFAREAGLDINMEEFARAVGHFRDQRAETGFLIYGLGGCQRDTPAPMDPEAMASGQLNSFNGGISAAGILMGFLGEHRAAHLCSLISAYAWNNTFGGHGGNFWNNFWTPLGANAHSKAAFINFWQNHRWYRECNRMFDGSLIQHESGKAGAGTGVALVAPRRRLQIVGAPRSPFVKDAPEFLKPALAAYDKKDYAGCEKLVNELLASGVVGQNELPTVEVLARAAREIQESVAADLARMNKLIDEGNVDEAKSFVDSLKAIMPVGDERLVAVEKAIAEAKPAVKSETADKKVEQVEKPRTWKCLVTEIKTARSKDSAGKVEQDKASIWRMKVVEDLAQAPEDWTKPKFDDSNWWETNLPISWRMYHTALFRTKFHVEDRKAFDGLRFRGWLFRQQGIEIYLNGELIGKVNNLEKKTGNVDAEFKESALKHLKNGENTLAVSTRHNWRWGMLSMSVYNDGFGFRLDARTKED